MRVPIGSVLPAVAVAQRFGCDQLVGVLHLPSSPSCREVGASSIDVAFTLVAGLSGPPAEVAGWVAHMLPLGDLARVVTQPACDRGLHQHMPSMAPSSRQCSTPSRLLEVSISMCMQ